MMKVCHIISGDLWAGAESMDYHLLKGLRQFGNVDLSAILFNEGRLSEEFRKMGIPLDIVDEKKLNIFQMLRRTSGIMAKRVPDIIHSHRYKENVIAFLTGQFKRGVQLISTQHGIPEYYGNNVNMKHLFLNRINFFILSRYFRKVTAVSENIRSVLITRYGFPREKLAVVHNGVNTIREYPPKTQEDLFVIGTSGRLFPVKDYPFLIEIAREIRNSTDEIRFELAGDGPERRKIEELVETYGLGDRFLLRGTIEDMNGFYKGLDLYINTSLHEGIPMSVLEAMAHGLAVVAPDVGGFREIIHDGLSGYLVERRDPKVFAAKCLELCRNRKARLEMATEARKKVAREFSFERMARDYYRLYLEVADRSHSVEREGA